MYTMPRPTLEREVGGNLADDRSELETVTGKTTAQDNPRMFRMMVDHEMTVGR